MRFYQSPQTLKADDGPWRVHIGEDWLQGRSAFGGVPAALGLRVMRQLVPETMPWRSLQVTFLAPMPAVVVNLRAQVLRAGKNLAQVETEVCVGDQTPCRLLGEFGVGRSSALATMPVQPAVEASPTVKTLRYGEGQMPGFIRQFKASWLHGALPFTGGQRQSSLVAPGLRCAMREWPPKPA